MDQQIIVAAPFYPEACHDRDQQVLVAAPFSTLRLAMAGINQL
jgi:hypothetical protein